MEDLQKSDVNENKIEGVTDFVTSNIEAGMKKGLKKAAWLKDYLQENNPFFMGGLLVEKALDKTVGYSEFEDKVLKNTENDIKNIETKLENFYSKKDTVSALSLNLAGGLIQGIADPITLGLNVVSGGSGLAVQGLANTADYFIEESIVHDRGIKDFGVQDIPGLAAGLILPKIGDYINAKKFKGGEFLFDATFNDNIGRTYKRPTAEEVLTDLKNKGVDTTDSETTLNRVVEATKFLKEISETEDPDSMKKMSKIFDENYGDIAGYVREKRMEASWLQVLEDGKTEDIFNPTSSQIDLANKKIDAEFSKADESHYTIEGKRAWSKQAVKNYFEGKEFIPENEEIIDSKPYTTTNYTRVKTGGKYYTMTTSRDTTFTIKTKDKETGVQRIREFYLGQNGEMREVPRDDYKLSSLDIVKKYIDQGEGTIPANQWADVNSRMNFDGPQGDYLNGMQNKLEIYTENLKKLDKDIENELAYKKRTNINYKKEMDVLFKPIKTNVELSLKQLEMEDARELFGATRNAKPFGNQLYDFSKQWDKREFVEILQQDFNMVDFEKKLKIYDLRSAGDTKTADAIQEQLGTFKVLKRKLNEYVGVMSQDKENASEIKDAFYINTFYNKRKYMQNLNIAIAEQDENFFKSMATMIGKDVEIDEGDVASIIGSMKALGKESRITTPGKYSLTDFPEEMGLLLRNDIEATTRAAEKGAYGKRKEISAVGKKWGNDRDYGNFAQSFIGTENEPYEVVSKIYSTVAKDKLGLSEIERTITDLTPGMKLGEESRKGFYQTISDRETGKYFRKQLEDLNLGGMVEERYKPNFNIDPDNPKLWNKVVRRAVKDFMSFKFLTSLNFIREEGMNKRMGIRGASQLGWDFKYSNLKSKFFTPIEKETGFTKAINAIRKENLDKIKDPVIRARAESFLTKRLANDPIMNDPTKWFLEDLGRESKSLKIADKVSGTLHKLAGKGAYGQTISDIHRTFNAEWLSKNYMMDILPNLERNATPILDKILVSNGIDDVRFNDLKSYLKGLDSDTLDDIIFSGKVAKTENERLTQELFEQFADVLGRKFNAFESVQNGLLGDSFVGDQWMLYKRFSLGALERTWNSLMNYYASDGHIRGRMSGIMEAMRSGEGLKGVKNTFEGANRMCLGNFAWTAAKLKLATMGITYITGKLSGTSNDERVEAEIDAMSRGEIMPSIMNGIIEQFNNETGINIVFGSQSVLGGFYNKTIKRYNLAYSSENLDPHEKVMYFTAATLAPEVISRGIDNMKFRSNIGTRTYSGGEKQQALWRSKYRREAIYEQELGKLPAEQVGEYLLGGAVALFSLGGKQKYKNIDDKSNFEKALQKNPDKAHDIMGTDKTKVDDDVAIIGASGVLQLTKEATELQAISEIMNEDKAEELKEKELFNLGLDVDTQARRMKRSDYNTLTAIMAYKGIRDRQEILTIMHQFNSTKDKNKFFNEMFISDDDYEMFESFLSNVSSKKKTIDERLKKRKNRIGLNGYIEILNILDDY